MTDPTQPASHYNRNPRYPTVGAKPTRGWSALGAALPPAGKVLAIDGPSALPWTKLTNRVAAEVEDRKLLTQDVRTEYEDWTTITQLTGSADLADDPDFERVPNLQLADLLKTAPDQTGPGPEELLVVFGPGAAARPHDVLWYADQPKRFAEAEVTAGRGRNLGRTDDDMMATTKRLFYIDWPLQDRHRDGLLDRIDLWIDLQNDHNPAALTGDGLRATIEQLCRQPFRARPFFNSTSWGGRWAQRELGFNPEAANTALGYELIAPESGVLVGDDTAEIEVPFQLLVVAHPLDLLGRSVLDDFGATFPIRFDYLDTVDGGNLSLHVHPQSKYMHDLFGLAYTQHESYYVVQSGSSSGVFLGLQERADLDRFAEATNAAVTQQTPLVVEQFVQRHRAETGQLYMIPAGTPHASGADNVVLEISATPYLYSLRFYDWLRADLPGAVRPVHISHAFANLDAQRVGLQVREDLIQQPRTVRSGPGWLEEIIGELPSVFFRVHRFTFAPDGSRSTVVADELDDRFHVLNVVAGEAVDILTAHGDRHRLNFAETLVVPAAVQAYCIRAVGQKPVQMVKAMVTTAPE